MTNSKYFYHCTNAEDVIYNGTEPIFEEYGPYIYKQSEDIKDVEHNKTFDIPGIDKDEYIRNKFKG